MEGESFKRQLCKTRLRERQRDCERERIEKVQENETHKEKERETDEKMFVLPLNLFLPSLCHCFLLSFTLSHNPFFFSISRSLWVSNFVCPSL